MTNGDIQSINSTGLFTDLMRSFNCMEAKIYNILCSVVCACNGSFTWTCKDQRKDTKHSTPNSTLVNSMKNQYHSASLVIIFKAVSGIYAEAIAFNYISG